MDEVDEAVLENPTVVMGHAIKMRTVVVLMIVVKVMDHVMEPTVVMAYVNKARTVVVKQTVVKATGRVLIVVMLSVI